ncbi:MAG: endolytic transglycosylase MltG [Candidatus Paceibacterota bacterium]
MNSLCHSLDEKLNRGFTWLGEHPLRLFAGGAVLFVVVAVPVYMYLASPPPYFPTDEVISVEEGEGLSAIASSLHTKNVIRSPFFFRSVISMLGGEKSVVAGDYYFEEPMSSFHVARRLIAGHYNMKTRVVTIPEGYNIFEMAKRFDEELLDFDVIEFLHYARHKDGRLFPDTYELEPTISPERLVGTMHATFNARIKEIGEEINEFGKPLDEVIIMASILEREAYKTEDRRRIADVLWRRLEIGMPLQVDAAFSRINGRNTYELTKDDLATDGPFNTYTRTGLPPWPIGNPGLDAILAAVTPIETNSLFFLADRSGNTYFSETFEEHVRKKGLYVN